MLKFIKKNLIINAIKKSIEELLIYGHKVILIYPTPETNLNKQVTNYLLDKSKKLNKDQFDEFIENKYFSYNDLGNSNSIIFNLYNSINYKNLLRVYPHKFMCNDRNCKLFDANNIFMIDQPHLSSYWNMVLSKKIINKIKNIIW